MKVVFLYLKAFSFTGGIEKFNRCFLKALHELSIEDVIDAEAISAYDTQTDEKYFHQTRFEGWGGSRILFIVHALIVSLRRDTVILGHINLSLVGWLTKTLSPKTKVIIVTHGIEVWKKLDGVKRKALMSCDMILSVSDFTRRRMIELNEGLAADKIKVFPNAIDPYFVFPTNFERPKYLEDRYGITPDEKILLTVTRLSSSEKYKGYDHVIEALHSPQLKNQKVKYLLCGKSDDHEYLRITNLIREKKLDAKVSLTGFIPEKELTDHYLLADVFVMPSKKEGFGIVFIESLACGLKVIAGSKDGSSETLLQGQLGKLIDPDAVGELIDALIEQGKKKDGAQLQKQVIEHFGFPVYKEKLRRYLTEI